MIGAARYFAPRYFARRYFPKTGSAVAPPTPVAPPDRANYGGGGKVISRRRPLTFTEARVALDYERERDDEEAIVLILALAAEVLDA